MTKRTKRVLVALGALLLVGVAFLVEERVRGGVALRAWEREMRAKGEKLTFAELAPPAPTNSATEVLTPDRVSPRLTIATAPTTAPGTMRMVAPGKAQALWQIDSWIADRKQTNRWTDLAHQFESQREAVGQLRQDLTNQAFVVSLDYSQGYNLLLPHLSAYKRAVQTLAFDVQLALREGRRDDAVADIVASLALCEQLHRDPLLIGELVSIAAASINLGATWESLQAEGWTDAQLATVQHAWQNAGFAPGMVRALQMERAMAAIYYDRARLSIREIQQFWSDVGGFGPSSDIDSTELGAVGQFFEPILIGSARLREFVGLGIWRIAWVEQDHLFYNRAIERGLAAGRQAIAEQHWPKVRTTEFILPREQIPSSSWGRMRCLLALMTLPGLEKAFDKAVRIEVQRALVLSAIALKRHQLRHGTLPEQLDALVPGFVSEVPRDWYSGKAVRYERLPDGAFRLYSVGEDGVDDGGDARPVDEKARANFFNGRDVVWPQPAARDEFDQFEIPQRRRASP
ncbi:MAG: hypothetical protein ACYDC1_13790 [Limisphaerales bacterium]